MGFGMVYFYKDCWPMRGVADEARGAAGQEPSRAPIRDCRARYLGCQSHHVQKLPFLNV